MNQNLNYYYIFYICAVEGKISKAAEKLYISQPAVSKTIGILESQLGVKLFIRSQKGVTLTSEGRQLYSKLETAFSSIEQAEEAIIKQKRSGAGRLKLAASASLCRYMLTPILEKYIELYPNVRISIDCCSTAQVLKLVEEDKADAGLIATADGKVKHEFIPLGELEDIFVAKPSYIENLCSQKNIDNSNSFIAQSNLMLLNEGNLTRQYVDKYLDKHGIKPHKILEITGMEMLIEFAKIGMGTACVIRQFIEEELKNNLLREIILKEPINKRTAGLVFKRQIQDNAAADYFISHIISDMA